MSETFVTDPLVPVELKLKHQTYFTLYQPGWHSADTAPAAFLGGRQGQVYATGSLRELAEYIRSGRRHSLSASPYLPAAKLWSVQEYAERVCSYPLTQPPEVADGRLDEHEQYSLGSTLALMLDLLDFTGLDDQHANALRDSDEVGRLAAGELLGGIFGAGRRQHVVDLLARHWSSCVSSVATKFHRPPDAIEVPGGPGEGDRDSGDGDGDGRDGGARERTVSDRGVRDDDAAAPFLEQVTDAVAVWFGFADTGVYTIRTTVLSDGLPAYAAQPATSQAAWAGQASQAGQSDRAVQAEQAGRGGPESPPVALRGWREPEVMARDLARGAVGRLGTVDLAADLPGIEVNCRPHDDLIFDLYEIGTTIAPTLSPEQAGILGEAWIELTRLAAWGGWADVVEQTAPTSPVGAFVLGCVSDVARGAPGADQALASADTGTVQHAWSVLLDAVLAHIDFTD